MDFPGIADHPEGSVPPPLRSFRTLEDAEDHARRVYREGDMPKVIVARLDNSARVMTIFGDRSSPTIQVRRNKLP